MSCLDIPSALQTRPRPKTSQASTHHPHLRKSRYSGAKRPEAAQCHHRHRDTFDVHKEPYRSLKASSQLCRSPVSLTLGREGLMHRASPRRSIPPVVAVKFASKRRNEERRLERCLSLSYALQVSECVE